MCAQRSLLGLCCVSVVVVLVRPASAQTQASGTVVQDTFLRAARPDDVYGLNTGMISGNDPAGWRTDAIIQFELPEAPVGQEVQSATLELFNYQLEWANRGSADFEVRAVMGTWSEEDDTWFLLDGDDPQLYGETAYDVVHFEGIEPPHGTREDLFPDEWKTWDVTELARSWYDGSIENNGLAILGQARFTGQAEGAVIFPVFYTKDYLDDESLHPALNITFGVGGGPPQLQAGDANMDLKFDQLDLVQVQIAAKYLTGEAATWGEGDWIGAPGGSPGIPPTGNGLFDQLDIIAALGNGLYLKGPYAAIAKGGARSDGQTSIVYDAGTGEVAVDAPGGIELTSINIDSSSGIFTGAAAANLGGSFDNDADNNIFKATFGSSFGSLSFGNVAQPGLSEDFVAGDLTVVGSLAGGGDLGNVDLIYVPEPATLLLSAMAVIAFAWIGRRPGAFAK